MRHPAASRLRSRERFVSSFDGTALFVERSGSGPPVILCDGLGCDGFIWRYLRPRLEQSYEVIHWHYRGHGLSQPPPSLDAMRIRDLMGDLRVVLDAHDIEKAVLVGHSLGVQVILEFALRHRERVAGLATVCGSYGTPLETFHNRGHLAIVFPALSGLVNKYPREAQRLWTGVVASELAYQLGLRTEVNGDIVKREDFAPYFTHLASMDVQVFMALLDDANQHSVETELDELAVPTLVVAGSRDSFTPAWLSEKMARLIPGAELLMVPGGTHVAPIEIPELIALRLERFLGRRVYAEIPVAPGAKKKKRRRRSSAASKKRVSKRATSSAAVDGRSRALSAEGDTDGAADLVDPV